jgi:ATP-dependent DNA helicase RecG
VTISAQQLEDWLTAKEDEHLEFKEAKNNFHFEKLVKYCAALSNEGGGTIVLGVTDSCPHRVVGSGAFADIERTKAGLIEKLRLRIEAVEITHPDGRVLIFTAPARPIGVPIPVEGAYWMRAGEELAPMTPDMLRRIFDESGPDFTAEICRDATLADLDPLAIGEFRQRWAKKAQNERVLIWPDAQVLVDAELVVDGGLTFAALILFGTRTALGRHLAQAEIIFEYRSSEASGPAAERQEFREGFFLFHDRLWELINKRNDRQSYQDGFFRFEIPTFDERPVREALLNAVCHRDYRLGGSVFVRQFARRLEIISPGGLPSGITIENILDEQNPRNRRLAEAFGRCGLVERSGQGMDLMFESAIRHSKPLPDFAGSAEHKVCLTLHGTMGDPAFVRFLEKIGQENLASFGTRDFLVLDLVHREQVMPEVLKPRLLHLREQGIVETIGRGRGTRYLLSRRFYAAIGQRGTYTRRRGLDRGANKALLLKHIKDNGAGGTKLEELQQVLPSLSRHQVQRLVRELKGAGCVINQGTTNAARWFPTGKAQSDAT